MKKIIAIVGICLLLAVAVGASQRAFINKTFRVSSNEPEQLDEYFQKVYLDVDAAIATEHSRLGDDLGDSTLLIHNAYAFAESVYNHADSAFDTALAAWNFDNIDTGYTHQWFSSATQWSSYVKVGPVVYQWGYDFINSIEDYDTVVYDIPFITDTSYSVTVTVVSSAAGTAIQSGMFNKDSLIVYDGGAPYSVKYFWQAIGFWR